MSAASICAKVTRDHALKVWKFREGLDGVTAEIFGSGYPGDPKTKKFLEENIDQVFGFPRLVRFSWQTASKMLDGKSLDVQFDEEDAAADSENGGIKTFFKSNMHQRHEYFRERHLMNVNDL